MYGYVFVRDTLAVAPYAAAPTVTSITPSTGSTAGGTSVTITGTNFTGATGVTIGGASATSVVVSNDTTITCTTPAGSAGTASVLVTTPGGTNAANTLFTYYTPAPEIAVSGNSVDITNGDTTPSAADNTDFGSVAVASGSVWHVFSVANSGTADLNLAAGVNRVTLSGPGASHFDVVTQIPIATVAASGTTSFVIAFDPSAAGPQTATVSIANDDSDENPFTFDVRGWGAVPSNGTLDSAFSGDGKVTTAPGGTGGDVATCMAVQPDGKTVVAGQSMIGGNIDFSVVRYLANGSLDSSFGSGGIVTTAVGVDHDVALAVAVQPDGKIVVAGYYYNVSNWDSVVVRYLPDGTLDSSFGSGGKAVFAFSASGTDVANGMSIQTDGKIVLAGETTSGGTVGYVARLTSAGALDGSFGTGGVTTLTAGGNTRFAAVQLQSDGKIVTTGWRTVGNIDVVLARFTTAGALDSSFDTDGWVTTAVGAGNDMANSLAIQPADGKIVVGGSVQGSSSDFMALRYTSAGALDSSFGTSGVVAVDVGGDLDEGTGVALQPDGKIVLGGHALVGTTYDFAAVRLTTTGTLDTTFDGDGKVITPVGLNQDYANAVVVHPDGGILLAGRAWDLALGNNDFALVRYGAAAANSAPTDITLTPSSIAENNAAGATVGTLAAVDADVADSHTFSFATGTGDTDNGSFTIAGTALKLTPSANYEVKSSYSLRVQANDGNGGIFAKALTVTITDVYEAPTPVFLGAPGSTGGGSGTGVIDAPNTDATASLGKWESIRSGSVLSSNGRIGFRGYMELDSGSPPVTVNDFQGIWKYDGTDTRLKARSGTAAPETGSALYDMLPLNPSISPDGLITFYGALRIGTGSPPVTASTNYGLWSEIGGGTARLLLREGDPVVSGKFFRSGFTVTTSTVNTAALNAKITNGSALIHLDVNTPSVLLTVVAEEGQAGPGGGTWIALDGNSSDPRLSANGDLGFIGWEKVGTSQIQGIYSRLNSTAVGTSGAVVQARVGGTAPGTSGATFNAFERPTVFNGGMAFRGFLNANGDNAGGTKGQGVWAGAFGALAPVVRTGDTNAQIPTVPAGRTVSSVWSPFSNALGSLTMRVSLVGAGETRAIMGSTGGTMRVIAKVGDAAPGLAGETFTNFDHPVIGDGDQVAFTASTNTGKYGIWKEAPGGGALSLVMKAGDTISTSEGDKTVSEISLPGATTDDRKFESRCMDATGRLLIHVTFSDGSTSLLLGQ